MFHACSVVIKFNHRWRKTSKKHRPWSLLFYGNSFEFCCLVGGCDKRRVKPSLFSTRYTKQNFYQMPTCCSHDNACKEVEIYSAINRRCQLNCASCWMDISDNQVIPSTNFFLKTLYSLAMFAINKIIGRLNAPRNHLTTKIWAHLF